MAAVPIQVLPSSDSYSSSQHFDPFQFANKRIHRSSNDELAVADFDRLHVERRKRTHSKRIQSPEWVNNEELLRQVLVQFLERRAYLKATPPPGTYQERIDRAEQAMAARVPAMQERMRGWIVEYKNLLDSGQPDQKRLHDLEKEIQNADRQICVIRKGMASTLLSVVYLYYRTGWDSVTVAEELGLTSTGVHQIIFQMRRLAAGAKRPPKDQKCCIHGHRLTRKNLRANGQCKACKNAIEKRYRQRHSSTRLPKTLCKYGHSRTPKNVYPNGSCKMCMLAYSLRWYHAKRKRAKT